MKLFNMLVLVLMFAMVEAHAEQAASRESVERLLALTEASKMMDAMQSQIGNMFNGMAAQMKLSEKEKPAFEKYMQKVGGLMKEDMSWDQFSEPIIKIYTKHFSEEEVQGLIKFYSSDVGRSMTKKMPLVMQESMLISQEIMKKVMPKIQALAVEMKAEIVKARESGAGK